MSAEQTPVQEVAQILARAALRLRARAALIPDTAPHAGNTAPMCEKRPDSAQHPLDLCGDRSVHGLTVNAHESAGDGGPS